jgi:hypothetical protein
MSVDCLKRRRYAALVGLGRPFCPWDEGEAASLHFPFDNPHDAVREHGTLGGRKQSRQASQRSPTALLFVRPWCVSRPTGPLKPSIAFRSDRWLDCKLPRCQFDNPRVPPIGTLGGRRGTKAKPLAAYRRRLCCLSKGSQYKISKIKFSISMIAVTPATESTNASLVSW